MEDDARFTLAVARTAVGTDGAAGRHAGARDRLPTGRRPGRGRSWSRTCSTERELAIRARGRRATRPASGAPIPDQPFGAGSTRSCRRRGAHLVVPRERIPATCGLTLRVPGRVVFLVPWPRLLADRHDRRAVRRAPIDRPPPAARRSTSCSATVNGVLDVDLTRDDVVGTYAGLRPLIAPSERIDGQGVARAPRRASSATASSAISGGKYTTYRVMARDAVDGVLGRDVARRRPSDTADRPVVGAADHDELDRIARELAAEPDVAAVHPDAAARLVARHGTESRDVVALGRELDLIRPLLRGRPPVRTDLGQDPRHQVDLGQRGGGARGTPREKLAGPLLATGEARTGAVKSPACHCASSPPGSPTGRA